MTRHRAVPFVILLISVLGGCSKESPSTSQATAPAASGVHKTGDTNIAGVAADVTECARKDGVLKVKEYFGLKE